MRNRERTLVSFLAVAFSAHAYVRLNTGQAPVAPLTRTDSAAIHLYLNSAIAPGLQNDGGRTINPADADPNAAIAAATGAYNAVSTANVHFLPLQPTTSGHDPTDGKMVIAVATSADDLSAVGSAVAITVSTWFAGPGAQNGGIVDSDILLNPAVTFSTNGPSSVYGSSAADLQAVLTHEFGHALGANHTNVLGATMFQYPGLTARFLSTDDLTFINSAYPSPSGPAPLGTISGKVSLQDGTGVGYALLTFIDSRRQVMVGGLSNPDGTYSIQTPEGSYAMYAEPFNSIVQPGNLYLANLSSAQLTLATTIQPTFYGGANPAAIAVTANSASTANLTVGAGTAFAPLYHAFGAAGANGDVSGVVQTSSPIEVASGQSIDFVFIGQGFDQTTTVTALGSGVTAGPVRVDAAGSTAHRGPGRRCSGQRSRSRLSGVLPSLRFC